MKPNKMLICITISAEDQEGPGTLMSPCQILWMMIKQRIILTGPCLFLQVQVHFTDDVEVVDVPKTYRAEHKNE